VLLALQPVLGLYANNAGKTVFSELIRPALVLAGASLALWLGLRLVIRDKYRAGLVASIVMVAALAGWNFLEYVIGMAEHVAPSLPWVGFNIAYALVCLACIVVFARRFAGQPGVFRSVAALVVVAGAVLVVADLFLRSAFGGVPTALIAVYTMSIVLCLSVTLRCVGDLVGWTQTLNWFAGVLLALYLLLAVGNVWRLPTEPKAPLATAGNVTPVPAETLAKYPDIYFVTLEGYASPDVLRRSFGYDASPFLDAMRAKGFQVAPEGRSNYALALFSITACLNMNYLQDALGARAQKANPFAEVFEIYHQNKVYDYLKSKGYSLQALAPGSDALEPRGNVDVTYKPLRSLTEFERVLGKSTVAVRLVQLAHYVRNENPATLRAAFVRERVNFTFGRLAELASTSADAPRFIFASVPIPGGLSLAFDRDGNLPKSLRVNQDPSGAFAGTATECKAAYVDQVTYLNTLLEKTADTILTKSKRPSVILFVSGNGPWFETTDTANKPTIEDRYSSLILEYLPPQYAGQSPLFPSASSVVNLFPITFSRVFGENLPLKPDTAFISTPARPLEFSAIPLPTR
jgi:hypothetical protein